MFSGAGLFRGALMFGLVADDVLYFKVGDANRGAYLDAGARPFTYRRRGAVASLTSYYEVPAAVLDDPDALVRWAQAARAAAQAAAKPKQRHQKKR
jgi:DNA transformation protein